MWRQCSNAPIRICMTTRCHWNLVSKFCIFSAGISLKMLKKNTSFAVADKRDSGGEEETRTPAPVSRPTPLAGAPLQPAWVLLHAVKQLSNGYFHVIKKLKWRRGWDSNPRALSDKRFSRPPRSDHFDTSPKLTLITITNFFEIVNTFFSNNFKVFSNNFKECLSQIIYFSWLLCLCVLQFL